MWWLLAIPFVGILGAAAAATKQRRDAAATGAASGAAASTAGANAGPGGTAQPAPGATTSQGQPTAGAQAQAGQLSQADMMNLVTVALASQNPTRMREAANQIRAQYPLQAQTLDAAALATEQAIAAAGGQQPGSTPATPATPSPAGTMTAAEVATLLGAALGSGNAQTMRDAAAKLRAAGYPAQATILETAAAAVPAQPAQPTPAQPATPPPATPAAGAMTTNDAMTLFNAAMTSGNVQTMKDASMRLRAAGFVAQANILDAAIAAASAAQPATPPPAPPTPAAPTMSAADAATLLGAAMGSGNPQTMRDAAAKLRAAGYAAQATILETAAAAVPVAPAAPPAPPPVTPAAPPANASGKATAAALNVKLKTAKKGTASEPKTDVAAFQIAERLPRTDGSYGSETALAIADRYGIVPAKPFYWGKKGGDYSTLVADKNQYKAHLLNLATSDPARADEWRSAAAV